MLALLAELGATASRLTALVPSFTCDTLFVAEGKKQLYCENRIRCIVQYPKSAEKVATVAHCRSLVAGRGQMKIFFRHVPLLVGLPYLR